MWKGAPTRAQPDSDADADGGSSAAWVARTLTLCSAWQRRLLLVAPAECGW